MPIDIPWQHRGGDNVGAVVAFDVGPQRLFYLTKNTQTGGWCIRDYIGGRCIRGGERDTHSPLTIAQVEQHVNRAEVPPRINAKSHEEWLAYLALRSDIIFDAAYDPATPPSSLFGPWQPLGTCD